MTPHLGGSVVQCNYVYNYTILINWSFYQYITTFFISYNNFWSVFCLISIATQAFFGLLFAWGDFFHPFTFNLFLFLDLKWISCRQHIVGSFKKIHSPVCLSTGELTFYNWIKNLIPNTLYFCPCILSIYHQRILTKVLLSSGQGFPGSPSGKEPTCQCRSQEMQVRSLGQEDPLEEEMATHSSILAEKSNGQWQAILQRVAKSWTWLSIWALYSFYIY